MPNLEPAERRFPELTARQEAFVLAYVRNGGVGPEAAAEAGYSEATARQQSYEILSNPKVTRAIGEAMAAELAAHAPMALARIAHLTRSAKSEYVQLEASKDLLTRVGLSAPKRVSVAGALSVTFDLGEG